jgi:hypothetical protein
MFDSRLASRRKFFTGPSAAPAPSPTKGPENPEGLENDAGRAEAAEGLPTSTQVHSLSPKANAASEHKGKPEESLPGAVPGGAQLTASLAHSEMARLPVPGEESSVSIPATGEKITNPKERPAAADSKAGSPESSRHHTVAVERRGSYRYKVERIDVLICWRRGEDSVQMDPPSMAGERTAGPASGVEPGGVGFGGAGANAVRDPDPASLSADFDYHEARIHDISLTGVCLIVDRLPPINRDLWVGLKGARPIVWSRVVLRSLSEPHPGRFMLRLSFKENCPYDLFKLAVIQMADA